MWTAVLVVNFAYLCPVEHFASNALWPVLPPGHQICTRWCMYSAKDNKKNPYKHFTTLVRSLSTALPLHTHSLLLNNTLVWNSPLQLYSNCGLQPCQCCVLFVHHRNWTPQMSALYHLCLWLVARMRLLSIHCRHIHFFCSVKLTENCFVILHLFFTPSCTTWRMKHISFLLMGSLSEQTSPCE